MRAVAVLLVAMACGGTGRVGEETPRTVSRIVVVTPMRSAALEDVARVLGDPASVPQDGTVVVGVVGYATDGDVRVLCPMTCVDAASAPVIVSRLRGDGVDALGVGMAGAIRSAGKLLQASGDAGVGHILILGNDRDYLGSTQDLQAARSYAIGLDEVDDINGIAAHTSGSGGWDREFLFEHVVESDVDFPSGWSSGTLVPPERADLSIAAETTAEFGEPEFLTLLSIVLTRLAHCPGDYNRDGVVDAQDLQDFLDDSDPMVEALYADWNFDNDWDGDDGPPLTSNLFGVDYSKFVTGYNEGCP